MPFDTCDLPYPGCRKRFGESIQKVHMLAEISSCLIIIIIVLAKNQRYDCKKVKGMIACGLTLTVAEAKMYSYLACF